MIGDKINIHHADYIPNGYSKSRTNPVNNQDKEIFLIAIATLSLSGTTFVTCGYFEYYEGMIASAFISMIAFRVIKAVQKKANKRIELLPQENSRLTKKRKPNKKESIDSILSTISTRKFKKNTTQAPAAFETDIYEID